jgi:hypothetical protein
VLGLLEELIPMATAANSGGVMVQANVRETWTALVAKGNFGRSRAASPFLVVC